jgi:hypothetical protein
MEKVMQMFEKGKTLDDFDGFLDSEVKNFYDKFSFKGTIPFYEMAVHTNRYTKFEFKKTPHILLELRKFFLNQMDPYNVKTIKQWFSRLEKFALSNKLTKEFKLDLFEVKNEPYPKGVFEYEGIYKNLHFENCKFNAAIFSMLGAKITDIIYSADDLYCRFDLKATDLFFRKDLAKKEIAKLLEENLEHLINYSKVINDDDFFIWMKIAEDKDALIEFNNEMSREKWLNLIESKIKEFGSKENFHLNLLKIFEKLHWIDIENEKELIFQIRLSKEKYNEQREFMLNYLSKHSNISQIEGKFCLKPQ